MQKMKPNWSHIIAIVIALVLLAEVIALPGMIRRDVMADLEQEQAAQAASNAVSAADADLSHSVHEPVTLTLSSPNSHRYISVGFSLQLEYSASHDVEISFSSSDPAIATVDENGVVTGISKGEVVIIADAENAQPAVCELFVLGDVLVFLSPSRQYGNGYSAGDTNEGDQMHRVADYCSEMLQTAGLEVYICPDEPDLDERGKIAAEMGAACYVAIHSNAGGKYVGTSSYYHNRIFESHALASAVYDTVATLTPSDDVLGVINGMNKDNGYGYKEIRFPAFEGIPSTLLEVEFHDKDDLALWIIDNAEPLGYAVAEGIFAYLERPTAGPVEPLA